MQEKGKINFNFPNLSSDQKPHHMTIQSNLAKEKKNNVIRYQTEQSILHQAKQKHDRRTQHKINNNNNSNNR